MNQMIRKIKTMNTVAGRLILTLLFLLQLVTASSQNFNNPNKKGPLGAEVNTFSGNLHFPRTEFMIPSNGFNLLGKFYYNSFNFDKNLGFGNGWSFFYNIRCVDDTSGSKTIIWGDGREDTYASLGGGNYKTPRGFYGVFTQYQPNKFLLTEPEGHKFYFDNNVHRKITRMEDRNGNFLNFNYTDSLLTSIVTGSGQSITLAYNSFGLLTGIVDAVASPTRTWTYTYDVNRNLSKVTDPLSASVKYAYLVNGPMKSYTDKNDNVLDVIYYPDFSVRELIGCNKRQSFAFDSISNTTVVTDHITGGINQVTKYHYAVTNDNIGWLTSLTSNCCGFNMTFEFDDNGNKVKQTDANGNATSFTYDARGNVLTITDALNQKQSFTYSPAFNNVTSYKDANGNITTMQYNAAGDITQITEPGNLVYTSTYNSAGNITSSTDPRGNTYNYTYDAYGNLTGVTGPSGLHVSMSYDARGNLLTFIDGKNNNTSLQYDILSRLKKITDAANNFNQVTYDAEGNMISFSNLNGESTQYKYDASNRLVQFINPLNGKTEYSYDAMDNVTSSKNVLGNPNTYTYDARNRISSIKDALGNTMTFDYDANGNITQVNSPAGGRMNFAYDQLNRITSASDLFGNIGSFAYDKNGNITSYTNGSGAVNTLEFDDKNRIVKITDPLGKSASATYDNNSNIATITDRNGKTSTFTYDSLNRVKTITDHIGAIITYAYDVSGNLISQKDENNNTTSYAYDNLNRPVSITYPDSKFIQFTYDRKGNVTTKRLTDGSMINFTYDTLNRLVSKALPGGQVFTYTYDALGRVLTASNSAGTAAFTYDALNRVTAESFDGRITRYTYNTSGRVQTIIYPDSTVITKNFDTRNRLISILKNNHTVVDYEYNNNNDIVKKNFPNGISTILQYDVDNRLTSFSTGGGTIQNTSFIYDNERNKLSVNRLNSSSLSEQFSYDNNYRITTYKRGIIGGSPLIQNTYTYDQLGNRTAANLNGTNTTYSINNLNQLTNSNNGTQNINFTYDNNGNLTYDGRYYKKYDAEGRLLADSLSPSNMITYDYDAFGRRVKKTLNGFPLKYGYAGASQIEERDGITNDVRTRTVFSNFLTPVLNDWNNNSFYFHQNEQNSVEAISNSAGSLLERYQYDVYGKQTIYNASNSLINGSLASNRFGFTGQEYDSASGSNRFFFRNYNPETGVFNQRDLIENGDGTGMYQYVHDNPANGIDVFGLDDCDPPPTFEWPSASTIWTNTDTYNTYINNFFGSITESKAVTRRVEQILKVQEQLEGLYKDMWAAKDAKGIKMLHDALVSNNNIINNLESFGKFASNVAKGAGVLDLVIKGANSYNTFNDPQATTIDKSTSVADVGVSGLQLVTGPAGAAYGLFDLAQQKLITGKSFTSALGYSTRFYTQWWYGGEVDWNDYNERPQPITHWKPRIIDCPQNGKPGGPRRRKYWHFEPNGDSTEVITSNDPNLIIGPDGEPTKKWVSVKDRLPYTILYENARSASAPAKYVKVITPIEPKQDPNTFQLGTFGFNNQTFTVPPATASYYTRLDCIDSLGLYVDLTAGYDQINNQAFWEFQAIDPATLLPPANPLVGFLLLQDSTRPLFGHGFVNFSIKPIQTAVTLDTIGARAKIVFDSNDTIPTNIAKNTIDAFPPVSHMNSNPAVVDTTTVRLSWHGTDDLNGVGVKYYSLYVSVNGGAYSLYRSRIYDTSINFKGLRDSTYCFFTTATDSVGNTEPLKLTCDLSVTIPPVGPLPLTWLYFNGVKKDKDVLLRWATGSEINTKNFIVERSYNGSTFTAIGTVNAMGFSTVTTNYSFTDTGALSLPVNVLYYRLKQVDRDGKNSYSIVVTIRLDRNTTDPVITVYPNPFSQTITLKVIAGSSVDKTNSIDLYTVQGKLVYHKTIDRQGNVTAVLNDLPFLTSGVYLLKTSVNGNEYTFKILKQ